MAAHVRASRWQGVAQLWCISDDWVFGPEPTVRALHQVFDGAPGRAELLHLHPLDVGARQLGHFGVFRRQHGERVWSLWLQRLEQAVPKLQPQSPLNPPAEPSTSRAAQTPNSACSSRHPPDAAENPTH